MKILITGVAGFIGSHLCEKLLSKGYSIIGTDNFDDFYSKEIKKANLQFSRLHSDFHFIETDIRNFRDLIKLRNEKIEIVIHLAAKVGVRPSIENPQDYINCNITGTHNILELMKAINCSKLIFASSSSVYGNNKKIPFSETDSVDAPVSPYAFTKKSCELMNFNYHHLYNSSIVNLRFFTVYGPRQRPDLAIHKFFDKIYKNELIELYGDGKTGRDYTYIEDIVNGIILSVEFINSQTHPVYEIINLGNNHPVQLSDLIHAIKIVIGKPVKTTNLPMQQGDVDLTFADISKAKRLLNYLPVTTLSDGLHKFKTWYENK